MSNDKYPIPNAILMSNDKFTMPNKKYDLTERTAVFAEDVIKCMKDIRRDEISRPLISQLIRSVTSIGANYMEADGAESKKDFTHKIGICRKESKETMHWLRMLHVAELIKDEQHEAFLDEAQQLARIFSASINTARG
jgi:four helix bundle protein